MNSQLKQMTTDTVRAVEWDDKQNCLKLLDQRRLPLEVEYLTLETAEEVAAAIHDMVVRGAPAIGITAAYGTVLAAQQACKNQPKDWRQLVEEKLPVLLNARPTAVNLLWAIRRMQAVMDLHPADPVSALLAEAQAIHREDIAANQQMGRIGAEYLRNNHGVLTHCNTGSLATGGYGTALGVIRTAFATGLVDHVYASETRPWLQGGRLTVWELQQDSIPVTLVADSTSAWLMQSGKISWVITGADRIAANGDVANKIGTYAHAVHARYHGIGFMVVAPFSTVDPDTPSGADIVVEEREAGELIEIAGKKIAPAGTRVYNPVFDITPAELVSVLVTERGAVEAPDREQISWLGHWKK